MTGSSPAAASQRPQRAVVLLDGLAQRVMSVPLWLLAIIVVVPNMMLFSVKPAPFAERFVAIAENPWDPPDTADFLVTSPLTPIIANTVGLTTGLGYTLLSLSLVFGLIVISCYLTRHWVNDLAARLILVAWASSPLINIELTWIGMYDPWTVFAATILTVGPRWAFGVGALVLGFNQFEQGVFIIIAVAVLRLVIARQGPETVRNLAIAGLGLALGRLLQVAYLESIDSVASRVTYIGDRGAERYLEAWRGNVATIFFSVYGVLWIPIVAMTRRLDTVGRRALIALHVALTIPILVALDTTRVFALITWPVAAFCAMWWSTRGRDADIARWSVVIFLLALVVPRVIVWDGSVYISGWDTFMDDWRRLP